MATLVQHITDLAAAVRDKFNAVNTKFAPMNIVFVFDGGGAVIAAGQQIDLPDLPAGISITGWTITTDTAATCTVDILSSTYANFPTFASITGSYAPKTTAAQKNQNPNWGSVAAAAGDCLRASVTANDNAKKITVTLRCKRT